MILGSVTPIAAKSRTSLRRCEAVTGGKLPTRLFLLQMIVYEFPGPLRKGDDRF